MNRFTLNAAHINPPNDAVNDDKIDRLLVAMRRNGWTGRELLVRPDGEGYRALTGAHRLAAAASLGIDVPVLLLEDDDLNLDAWSELDDDSDAEDIVIFLVEQRLAEAAEILEQESHLSSKSYLTFLRHWLRRKD